MGDIANITLSKEIIEPIVKAQLQASITAALGRSDELVAHTVQAMMNMNVDSNGKPEHRGYGGRPLITWMAEEAIKDAAKAAIQEWFAENRAVLKKHIQDAIKKNAKGMAEGFVLNISKAVESTYGCNITVHLQPKD